MARSRYFDVIISSLFLLSTLPFLQFTHASCHTAAVYCFLPLDEVESAVRAERGDRGTKKADRDKHTTPYARYLSAVGPAVCTHLVLGWAQVCNDATKSSLVLPNHLSAITTRLRDGFTVDTSAQNSTDSPAIRLLLGVRSCKDAPSGSILKYRSQFATTARRLKASAIANELDGFFLSLGTEEQSLGTSDAAAFFGILRSVLCTTIARNRRSVVLGVGRHTVIHGRPFHSKILSAVDTFYLAVDDTRHVEEASTRSLYIDPLFYAYVYSNTGREHTIIDLAARLNNTMKVPRERIIVGLTTWARSYRFDNAESARANSSVAGMGPAGAVTRRHDGRLSFGELCALNSTLNWIEGRAPIEYDPEAVALHLSIALDNATGTIVWYTANAPDHDSFRRKITYIVESGLGGLGLDNLGIDDPSGECCRRSIARDEPDAVAASRALAAAFPFHRSVGRYISECKRRDAASAVSRDRNGQGHDGHGASQHLDNSSTSTSPLPCNHSSSTPGPQARGMDSDGVQAIALPCIAVGGVPNEARNWPCTRLCSIGERAFSGGRTVEFDDLQPEWCSHIVIRVLAPDLIMYLPFVRIVSKARMWIASLPANTRRPKLIISVGANKPFPFWYWLQAGTAVLNHYARHIQYVLQVTDADGVEISFIDGALRPERGDSGNLATLLALLRDFLGAQKEILLAVTPLSSYNDNAHDRSLVAILRSSVVDYVVLQADRFHSPVDDKTAHHSPLESNTRRPYSSINWLIDHWRNTLHVPARKLVLRLGVKAHGQIFPAFSQEQQQRQWKIGDDAFSLLNTLEHDYEKPGQLSRQELCGVVKTRKCNAFEDPATLVPHMIVDNHEFISYDDITSMRAKVHWAAYQNIGGLAIHDLELDNAPDSCPLRLGAGKLAMLKEVIHSQYCRTCVQNQGRMGFTTLCVYDPSVSGTTLAATGRIPYHFCRQILLEGHQLSPLGTVLQSYDDKHRRVVSDRKLVFTPLIASIKCSVTSDELRTLLTRFMDLLVTNIATFLKQNNFDGGVELNCDDAITVGNRHLFTALLKKLDLATLDGFASKLSIRVPPRLDIQAKYDFGVLNSLRAVNLGAFFVPVTVADSGTVTVPSPLFGLDPAEKINIHSLTREWIAHGLKPNKIVVLLPSHGERTSEGGFALLFDQAKVCRRRVGSIPSFLHDYPATYFTLDDVKAETHVGIETPFTVRLKVNYAMRNGLAGAALQLNYEDSLGVCHEGAYFLLGSIASELC